jgi:hypothetical protein
MVVIGLKKWLFSDMIVPTVNYRGTEHMKMTTVALCILLVSLAQVSFALTVEEVIKLKKEGVSDETIQLMIQQEMQGAQLADPYKNMGVTEIKKPDGKSSTIYSTGESEDEGNCDQESEREDKAWQMLDNVLIDTRHGSKDYDKKHK